MLNNKQPIASFKDSRPSGELCYPPYASVSFGSDGAILIFLHIKGITLQVMAAEEMKMVIIGLQVELMM